MPHSDGKSVSLDHVPPPANALPHTLAKLAADQPVHLVAMPPYDEAMAAALREQFPKAEFQVTIWPTEGKTLAELRSWAKKFVALPDLVVRQFPRRRDGK